MGKKILVVYFSGTGGTRKAAETVAAAFSAQSCDVHLFSLDDLASPEKFDAMTVFLASADALVLLYAVHALDAPEPVYSWIARLGERLVRETGHEIPAMVLSVSGGGEAWPNTTCRQACIASLEKKGFRVDYEDMLVMPVTGCSRSTKSFQCTLYGYFPASPICSSKNSFPENGTGSRRENPTSSRKTSPRWKKRESTGSPKRLPSVPPAPPAPGAPPTVRPAISRWKRLAPVSDLPALPASGASTAVPRTR